MGKQVDYDIVGSYDNQRYPPINAERTINMFEYIDPQGKKPKSLIFTSGLLNTISFGAVSGGSRASFVFNNSIFQIFGNTIFLITGTVGSLIKTVIGTLTTSTGYVGVDANTFQVIFVDGALGYIWDINTMTFVQITDPAFPTEPLDVCYLDGFFIVINGGTNTFQLSTINQGLIWGSDFTPSSPDAFLATSGGSPNLVLSTGSTTSYPVGTGIQFSGAGTIPVGTPAITKTAVYYVVSIVDGVTFTISPTVGGPAITFSTTGTAPIFVTHVATGNSITATSGGSPNLVLLVGTTVNYQVGTPIVFNGSGTLPVGTPPIEKGVTYFVKSVINATTFTISVTDGGPAITFSTTGTAPIFVTNNGQLQLGSITSHPGTVVACKTLHRRIFFFSQNFTEVWENAGLGTNLPFRRNNALLMEVGTPAIASVQVGFDRMVFLAQDADGLAGVMGVTGSQSGSVSNRALDFQLAQYASTPGLGVADAWGTLIKENGIIFYRLNFTAANHTFVLNVSMSNAEATRWHEEETLRGNRHPAQTQCYFDGNNFYGDFANPVLYLVSNSTTTNYSPVTLLPEQIKRTRIGRQMTPEGYNRIRIDRFHLDLIQGSLDTGNLGFNQNTGLANSIQIVPYPPNAEPVVFLSYSKDGGQTFGYNLRATMGKIGERTHRTVWRKLGVTPRGQGFVPKIEFYSEIPFIILGAAWVFETMPE